MTALTLTKGFSKGMMLVLGISIILLAGASALTDMQLPDMLAWAQKVFGWGFAFLFMLLLSMGGLAIVKLRAKQNLTLWYEVGQQSANGIATLALTFTLLGISLGIGSLSDQPLNPENIQSIIADLTRQFSTAFMTTVVGLPAASVIRAWIGIQYRANEQVQEQQA